MADLGKEKLESDIMDSKGPDDVVSVSSSSSKSIPFDPKTAFTKRQKSLFVVIAAMACFLSPLSSTMFLPAIPNIAADFHTTGTLVNVSNSIFCAMMAISPCLLSPIANLYGRRNTSLVCSVGYTVAAFLVCASQNLAMFYVFRGMMALFGTSFFSLGATIVGDVYIPQERGKPMSYILIGSQLGTAFASLIGGVLVHFTTWRIIFVVLGGFGIIVTGLTICFLKETGTNIALFEYQKETGKKFKFFKFNPLTVMIVTRYETVLLALLMASTIMYNMYSMMTPLRYVVDERFNITSSIISALFYLPSGIGYLVGSFFGGRIADQTVKKYIEKRGKRIAEDRLRCTYIWFGLLLPSLILIYGWSIEKKLGGIALPVIMMFINGVAQTMCFPSINSYSMDLMPHMAGDSVSNSYFLRFIWTAIGSGTVLPLVNSIGTGWTYTINAGLLWFGFALCIICIRFGERLRRKRFPEIFHDTPTGQA